MADSLLPPVSEWEGCAAPRRLQRLMETIHSCGQTYKVVERVYWRVPEDADGAYRGYLGYCMVTRQRAFGVCV